MNKTAHRFRTRGFTLVELLVVVSIIAILAVVSYLLINPLEVLRRTRDVDRLGDLGSIQQAIDAAVTEATVSAGKDVYCNGADYPCGGQAGNGQSNNSTRMTNGTGWVKVNLGVQKTVVLSALPIDRLNNSAYHYTYCADQDGWEVDAVLESDKEKVKMKDDGGNEDDKYEVGTNLNLIAASGGSCTY